MWTAAELMFEVQSKVPITFYEDAEFIFLHDLELTHTAESSFTWFHEHTITVLY